MPQQQQRYRVIEKVAAGGMAEVYRAESAGLEGFKKIVAIKRVLPHLSEKKEFIGMFLDEARLSASLSHSNVVQVFDIGVGDDTYFIVMEYVDGANLKAIVEHRKNLGRPLPLETACFITLRTCEGLSYAHEALDSLGQPLGIVHRDVSPPNVLISRHGEVKVVDFGLAKANSQLEASEPGIIKGKFSYLSPEAANGEEVDHRTDIFATGIILWEMITGTRLFLGDSDIGTVRQVQAARVPPLSKYVKDVPPALEHIVSQALARDPRARYQSARDFGRDLNQVLFQLGRPVSSFDIGSLVAEVRDEQRRQKGARPKQQTLIGSLIQDAMMSFRSLKNGVEEESSVNVPPEEQSGVGAIPLSFGTFEGSHTSAKVPPAEPRADSGRVEKYEPRGYEAGNLAALEEDGGPGARSLRPRGPRSGSPRPTPPMVSFDPAVLTPGRSHSHPIPSGAALSMAAAAARRPAKLPVSFWVIAASLVAVAAAVGAYVAGMFSS